jgi:hypothetical protein
MPHDNHHRMIRKNVNPVFRHEQLARAQIMLKQKNKTVMRRRMSHHDRPAARSGPAASSPGAIRAT